MKFTETATVNEEIPVAFDRAAWIESMIKELDKRNKTPDEVAAIEMALAREGSMQAIEDAKIKKARVEERKKAKKRLNFERKKAEEKLAKEKQLAKELAEENVRNLLVLKVMSDEQIALALGLPLKKIKQLKKELNIDEN